MAPRRRVGWRCDTARHGVTDFWNCSATFLPPAKISIIQGTHLSGVTVSRHHGAKAPRRVALQHVATRRHGFLELQCNFSFSRQHLYSVVRHSVKASQRQGVASGGAATRRNTAQHGILELQCNFSFSRKNLYNLGNTSVRRHSVEKSQRQSVAAGGIVTRRDTASRLQSRPPWRHLTQCHLPRHRPTRRRPP